MTKRKYTLKRAGLKLLRNAAPESINPITEPLVSRFGGRRTLDLRSWDDGDPLRIPHIAYFSERQIMDQDWPAVSPLGLIVRGIVEQVPSLSSPVSLHFDKVHDLKHHTGERFLALKLNDESRKRITAERGEVIAVIHKTMLEERKWPKPSTNMTLAYGSPETSQASWNEVVAHVASLLPLEIEFEQAITLPCPPARAENNIDSPTA